MNELHSEDIVPEAPVVDLAPGDEPAAPAEDNIHVEASPADEPASEPAEPAAEAAGEEEPAKPEKIDAEPEVTPATQARLDKLEKQLGYEMRQRKKLEKQLSRRTSQPEKDLEAPKQDDFENYEDYDKARIKYEVQKGIQEYEEQVSNTVQSDISDYVADIFETGQENYTDFIQKASSEHNPTLPITEQMLRVMRDNEMENPDGIIYYLARNVKDCQTISRLSPMQQTRALSKIEDKVAAELSKAPPRQPVKNKVSSAPPPVKPTGAKGVISKNPSEMSQKEYEQWRKQGGGV